MDTTKQLSDLSSMNNAVRSMGESLNKIVLNFNKAMRNIQRFTEVFNPEAEKRYSSHWASKKGYKHQVNPTFRSRPVMVSAGRYLTPAEFRRFHLGRTSTRWQKKDQSNA